MVSALIVPEIKEIIDSVSRCCNPDCDALKTSFESDHVGIICTSCGTIQSTGQEHFVAPVEAFITTGNGDRQILSNDNFLTQSSLPRSVKYSQSTATMSQQSKNSLPQQLDSRTGHVLGTSAQREAHRALLYLTRRIGMSQINQDETIRKFAHIMQCPKFSRTSVGRRRTLAAVATYLTALEQGIPLTMGSLVGLMNNSHKSDQTDFHSTYMRVLQELPELKPKRKMDYSELISATLALMKGYEGEQERKKVADLTNRLLPFDWRHNGTECYAPVHGIVAASYLAWKWVKPKERARVNLQKFCHRLSMPYWNMSSRRLVRLTKALVKVGQSAACESIPCREVTKKNFYIYLEGIVLYDENSQWDLKENIPKELSEISDFKMEAENGPNVSFSEIWKAQDLAEAKPKPEEEDDNDLDDQEIESYLCDDEEVKIRSKMWDLNGSL